MNTPDNDYTLKEAELPAIRSMLRFQADNCIDKAVTKDTFDVFVRDLDGVDWQGFQNPIMQKYLDTLFSALSQPMSMGQPPYTFVAIYIMHAYALFCDTDANCIKWISFDSDNPQDFDDTNPYSNTWQGFLHGQNRGWHAPYEDGRIQFTQPWSPPAGPPGWRKAVCDELEKLKTTPTTQSYIVIDPGPDQHGKFDEKYYTDSKSDTGEVKEVMWVDTHLLRDEQIDRINTWLTVASSPLRDNIRPLWDKQKQDTCDLLSPTALSAEGYFFLLHLLIGLATGDAPTRGLAQQIVNAATDSPEYPNDTLINQLVYLTLMHLADPLGAYGWDNERLQSLMQELQGVIPAADPASTAIKVSLAQHGKVLSSEASYPMTDPYTPSTGFTQRVTDTLFALDKARAALNKTLNQGAPS